MLNLSHHADGIPLDAVALCELLARILYRCLKDQDLRLRLFPDTTERLSIASGQKDGQEMQEMSHV